MPARGRDARTSGSSGSQSEHVHSWRRRVVLGALLLWFLWVTLAAHPPRREDSEFARLRQSDAPPPTWTGDSSNERIPQSLRLWIPEASKLVPGASRFRRELTPAETTALSLVRRVRIALPVGGPAIGAGPWRRARRVDADTAGDAFEAPMRELRELLDALPDGQRFDMQGMLHVAGTGAVLGAVLRLEDPYASMATRGHIVAVLSWVARDDLPLPEQLFDDRGTEAVLSFTFVREARLGHGADPAGSGDADAAADMRHALWILAVTLPSAISPKDAFRRCDGVGRVVALLRRLRGRGESRVQAAALQVLIGYGRVGEYVLEDGTAAREGYDGSCGQGPGAVVVDTVVGAVLDSTAPHALAPAPGAVRPRDNPALEALGPGLSILNSMAGWPPLIGVATPAQLQCPMAAALVGAANITGEDILAHAAIEAMQVWLMEPLMAPDPPRAVETQRIGRALVAAGAVQVLTGLAAQTLAEEPRPGASPEPAGANSLAFYDWSKATGSRAVYLLAFLVVEQPEAAAAAPAPTAVAVLRHYAPYYARHGNTWWCGLSVQELVSHALARLLEGSA